MSVFKYEPGSEPDKRVPESTEDTEEVQEKREGTKQPSPATDYPEGGASGASDTATGSTVSRGANAPSTTRT